MRISYAVSRHLKNPSTQKRVRTHVTALRLTEVDTLARSTWFWSFFSSFLYPIALSFHHISFSFFLLLYDGWRLTRLIAVSVIWFQTINRLWLRNLSNNEIFAFFPLRRQRVLSAVQMSPDSAELNLWSISLMLVIVGFPVKCLGVTSPIGRADVPINFHGGFPSLSVYILASRRRREKRMRRLPASSIRCLALCCRPCQNCQALASSSVLFSSRNTSITIVCRTQNALAHH